MVATINRELLEVYFVKFTGDGLISRIMHDIVVLYSKAFEYPGDYTHCIVRLGSLCYEVSLHGTVAYPYTDELKSMPELRAYFTLDVSDIDPELLAKVRFMLSQDVQSNRRLDWKACFSYLRQFKEKRVQRFINNNCVLPHLNYNIPIGFKWKRGDVAFNLPFTCSTQVANIFNLLFGIEPSYDSHIPDAMFANFAAIADAGVGLLFVKELAGV